MNHYERIVSYIHQYQGGVKGANVGYAKIEKRGEDCRIQVQLRNGHLSKPPQSYLFKQLEGGIRTVPMGEMSLSGNEIYYKGSTAVGSMFGADLSLEEADGLLVYLNRDYYFATSWKNDSIYLGNWSLEGQGEERIADGRLADEEKGIGQEMSAGVDSGRTEDASREEAEEQSEGLIQEDEKADGEERGGMQIAAKEKVQDIAEGGVEQLQEKGRSSERETAVISEGLSGGRGGMHETGERRDEGQKKERVDGAETADTSQLQMQAICGVCPFKRQNVDYGKRILLSFPTMRPFPEEKGSECVRLELQDIGCLPMKYWSLSGNRFLLHGYYCYRHLIFCQKEMGKYMLGVPGIYSDREQKNAIRFGFHSFQSIGEFGRQQGAFGYWLMELA